MGTRGFRIAFNDRINDQAVLFLKVQVVVLGARAWGRALKVAARNDALADKLEELRKTPVLGCFGNREVKIEIRIACRRTLGQTLRNLSMGFQNRFDLGGRPARGREAG